MSFSRFCNLPMTLLGKLPRNSTAPFCPSEVRETVPVPLNASLWARFRRYAGIGFLISVGYMDPGNWATDIEGGSRLGYSLLCVVLLSSLIAMLLQTLCVRLGMATGRDLAQLCRERFHPKVNGALWLFAQIAIIACDFAEVLGTALALKLLFGLPLTTGILLAALDTFVVLALHGAGKLRVEGIVMAFVAFIAAAFFVELIISKPDWSLVAAGFIPSQSMFTDSHAVLLAIGILGATVMPHNLYLHSSAVTSRKLAPGIAVRRDAIRLLTWDTIATLSLAFFVNAAILIVAATVFHYGGHPEVAGIDEAYHLLAPLLGTAAASILFGLALFVAGQSSTLTGTIAGQVILQGFLNLRIPCWQQRFLTRIMALVPAWVAITLLGDGAIGKMLVLSQVVLSMQLPFAIVPLIKFNSTRALMGEFRLSRPVQFLCWLVCFGIIAANLYLLYSLVA